jgi:Ser/Thr protein kinase RdoA (MazF antagonist)
MNPEITSLLSPTIVKAAARQWGATSEPELLDDVTNMVYALDCAGEKRILRLTHSSHHTEDEILAELDWVEYLISHGVAAAQPLRSRGGQLTEHYPVGDSYFTAAGFAFAPGHFIDSSNPDEWNPPMFQALGRLAGSLHRLTKAYNPGHLPVRRHHWLEEDTLRQAGAFLPAEQIGAADEIEVILRRFERLTPDADSFGLVHCDLNPTNFHVDAGRITLFDFDDCAYNWFINDIAVLLPLYSRRFNQPGWENWLMEFFGWFMRGYNEENHLHESWLELLPDSLRLQNLITLVACHQANVPNSQYHSFYELVLKTYREGCPLFEFDFQKALQSSMPGIHKS